MPEILPMIGEITLPGVLRIVAALASRWGYREEGTGTVVWAEFPAPAADGPGRGRGTPLSGPG